MRLQIIYKYKDDLALNNLQWLICHKIQLNQTKQNRSSMISCFTFIRSPELEPHHQMLLCVIPRIPTFWSRGILTPPRKAFSRRVLNATVRAIYCWINCINFVPSSNYRIEIIIIIIIIIIKSCWKHEVPWLSLSLSPSLSSIAPSRSSRLHPMSAEPMYVSPCTSANTGVPMWRSP